VETSEQREAGSEKRAPSFDRFSLIASRCG
jgi:hypothetical protein